MPNIAVLQEKNVAGLVGTYASNCTNGSALCCAITNAAAGITYTCSDPTNGAWTQADNKADSGLNHSTATFYLNKNINTTALTVTVVSTGGSSSERITIAEIGNTSGFDTHAAADVSNPGTGADAITTGNATPSVQPGLLWSYIRLAVGSGALTPGTGFTIGDNTDPNAKTENKRYTSLAAAAGTWTDSVGSDDCIVFALWFKESAAADGPILMGQIVT